jgi:hypothetical protein
VAGYPIEMTALAIMRRLHLALPLGLVVLLTGCINVVPFPTRGEKEEGMALARILKRLGPDAKTLMQQEHDCANELKIDLDETGDGVTGASGSQKFSSYIDRLIAIRDKRQQIQETVRQGVWQSPMVHVVQHDAIVMLGDEISRTQTWIQFTQNLRLRAELGRHKDYPELPLLTQQLDAFLTQTLEEPLYTQMRALQEEYRFGEGELGP